MDYPQVSQESMDRELVEDINTKLMGLNGFTERSLVNYFKAYPNSRSTVESLIVKLQTAIAATRK